MLATASLKRARTNHDLSKAAASGPGGSTASVIRKKIAGSRTGGTAFSLLADVLLHYSPEVMRLVHPVGLAQALLRSMALEELGVDKPSL